MFSGKLCWGAGARYRGKNGQSRAFRAPRKALRTSWDSRDSSMRTTDKISSFVANHFTTCVDQHPHWSSVGRTAHHLACTHHRTLLNNFCHFLINLRNFCAIGHWTHKPKGYKHSLNVRSKGASQKNTK
jgi:hypothetical protein